MDSALQSPERRSVSVVTPVYNSEASVAELCRRVREVLPRVAAKHEIILVNNGSLDRTWDVIFRTVFALADSPWSQSDLMRNYGQHNALLCGIRAAKCEVIVTMDDDLQHPPEEIPRLLARLDEGFDVVYGAPEEEQNGLYARSGFAHHVTYAAHGHRRRCGKKRERIPGFSHATARGIFRLQISVWFHRCAAHPGNDALRRANCHFPAALLRLFKLCLHATSAPCARHDDRV
jgi:glycosyltransferase involved in cell wall biosynthesis